MGISSLMLCRSSVLNLKPNAVLSMVCVCVSVRWIDIYIPIYVHGFLCVR